MNVDEWRSLLRLWGGFHQDAYFNLLHLPNAVMLEKSRSIIRALFYTHPFYTRSEEDNTRSISQRKSEDIDKSRVNSEPPCILLIVGKPNTFGMIKLFKQHLQYAHFPAQSSTSKSYSHLVLKDSIKSVKESEAGMLENELYKGETKQGIDVCQMSSRDFMFSKHVPDFDVVYGPFERRPEDYIKIDSTFKKEFKYIE